MSTITEIRKRLEAKAGADAGTRRYWDCVEALLDIAESAHRGVESWAEMQRPAHPDSAVAFMQMSRAVDDMDLGLNRIDGLIPQNQTEA